MARVSLFRFFIRFCQKYQNDYAILNKDISDSEKKIQNDFGILNKDISNPEKNSKWLGILNKDISNSEENSKWLWYP